MPDPGSDAHAPPRRGGIEWNNLSWPVIIGIGAMHVIALGAFIPGMFSLSGLLIGLVLVWVTAGLGITLCYHRLLTHRSFKTPKWFEYVLTVCGCLAWQGGPVTWVGVHRLHHKHSDSEHDPHSPQHGFTWAHMLWTLHDKIEGINGHDAAKDLLRDTGLRLLDKYFWVPQFVLTVALFGIGALIGGWQLGLSWIVWAVAVRVVFVYHGTWFVNSAAHTWGYQNYEETGEKSTNLWWVALWSFGEGWHNNHHAHPRSAAHGLRWFEFDLTYWTIRALSVVGLAKQIVLPREDQMPKAVGTKAPKPQASTTTAIDPPILPLPTSRSTPPAV
jgi:stearoyl-CoA desaturase (delta-9 desaturase)